jgi:hypothetical protein
MIHLRRKMKRKLMLSLFALMAFGFMATPLHADFVQCLAGIFCQAPDNSDIINGTLANDIIRGGAGDDIIFGNAGGDQLSGDADNDLVFGDAGTDLVFGNEGNDILLPGPDGPIGNQTAAGNQGNDTTNVLVGDVGNCLLIIDAGGTDVANLIGIGPYSAQKPFGQPGFGMGFVHVIDPIAGGDILIQIRENDDTGIETIHGLPSPNVTILAATPAECGTF